jgi:lipoprotein-releasing system permease protein
LITRISVIGIATITAALVILLSAFNGIETMIADLYSEFDTDITVRVKKGKSFHEDRVDFEALNALTGVAASTKVIEEVVILKRDKKWVSVTMLGVEPVFLEMTNTQNHLGEGVALLENQGEPRALIGANVLAKLEGYIPKQIGTESVVCYVPKRDAKIRPGKSPFSQERIALSGSVRYNREVSSDAFIIPIDLAKKLMGYGNDINAIYIDAEPGVDNSVLKERVAATLGADFVVKTSYEKNELIFKTSQSERVIVLIILLFIFVLAAFNLVASLTMLFVEKRDDVRTMISYGIPRSYIFRIFFFEGLLISGKGILIGLVLGYGVCAAQLQWALLKMPNSNGESFPIAFSFSDGLIIFGLVTLLSVLFSYFPVRYLIRKNIEA